MKKRLRTFQLYRALGFDQGTPGILLHKGEHVCYMMELPDRDNQPNISRIPPGTYLVKYIERSASGKYRDVYHITGVPDRTGILAHPGNVSGDVALGYKTDSWGCTLPALRLGELFGQLAGLASRAALNRLHQFTGRQDFLLEVY